MKVDFSDPEEENDPEQRAPVTGLLHLKQEPVGLSTTIDLNYLRIRKTHHSNPT